MLGEKRFTFESNELHHHNLIRIFIKSNWKELVNTFIPVIPDYKSRLLETSWREGTVHLLGAGDVCFPYVFYSSVFWCVFTLLTNIYIGNPKLDLCSLQKNIHSEHLVLPSSCIPSISARVTSLIFSDKWQLFFLL